MMKYIVLLACVLSISCRQKKTETEALDKAPLPPSSVYWLDSHWKDQNGNDVLLKDLRGKVVVLAMIFTSCKTSCPRLVADVQSIEQGLDEALLRKTIFLLCSIDPEYDVPARLNKYAQEHELTSVHWKLLTGSQEAVQEMSALLGVKFKKTAPMEISHSNIITVLDQNGEINFQQEGIEGDPQTVIAAVEKTIAEK